MMGGVTQVSLFATRLSRFLAFVLVTLLIYLGIIVYVAILIAYLPLESERILMVCQNSTARELLSTMSNVPESHQLYYASQVARFSIEQLQLCRFGICFWRLPDAIAEKYLARASAVLFMGLASAHMYPRLMSAYNDLLTTR